MDKESFVKKSGQDKVEKATLFKLIHIFRIWIKGHGRAFRVQSTNQNSNTILRAGIDRFHFGCLLYYLQAKKFFYRKGLMLRASLCLKNSVNSVVEFIQWWVLKSKIFGKNKVFQKKINKKCAPNLLFLIEKNPE